MRLRNSSKECLPVIVFFLFQLRKMLVIKLVGDWDMAFIEPRVSGFGSANQENRDPSMPLEYGKGKFGPRRSNSRTLASMAM